MRLLRTTTGARGVAGAITIGMLAVVVGGCAQQSDDPAPGSVTTSVVTVTRSFTPSSSDTTSTTTTAASAYTPTAIRAQGRRGTTTFDVDLPQVSGGEAAVRERFNGGMRAALDDVVGRTADTTVEDGSLAGDTRSAVTTTGTVVAGVAIFSAYAAGAAHPNNLVSTITINATTAKPILLSDVLTDPNATSPRLAALVTQIDDRATDVPPVVDSFLNWVPVTAGIRFYVPVIHALGDWLPVTVPWNDLSAYLRPGMAEFLGGQ